MRAEMVPSGGDKPFAIAVGYSARALAYALSLSGFRVISVDAFGDYDLGEIAEETHILPGWRTREAEQSLRSILERLDTAGVMRGGSSTFFPVPVFLAGGCENWPELIGILSKWPGLAVLGPDERQMQLLRSLSLWRDAAVASGLKFPPTSEFQSGTQQFTEGIQSGTQQFTEWEAGQVELGVEAGTEQFAGSGEAGTAGEAGGEAGTEQFEPQNVARDSIHWGRRLRKSLLSAGGASVYAVEEIDPLNVTDCSIYLQREIRGRVLGATCRVDWLSDSPQILRIPEGDNSGKSSDSGGDSEATVHLLGATESWQAVDWPGPSEFSYRGSWGPIGLSPVQQSQVVGAARFLAMKTGVRGWLQLDLIEDSDGQLWLIEVNPRWSAGMEILLRNGRSNPAAAHAQAWGYDQGLGRDSHGSVNRFGDRGSKSWFAKATLYCAKPLCLDQPTLTQLQALSRNQFADIPANPSLRTTLEPGQPLLTVFASIASDRAQADARRLLLQEMNHRLLCHKLDDLTGTSIPQEASRLPH